jgi:hypothetical protein
MSIAVGEVISGDKRGIATFQQEEEEEAGLICKDAGLRRWSRLGCDRAAAELLFRSVFAMIRFVNTTTDWEGRGGGAYIGCYARCGPGWGLWACGVHVRESLLYNEKVKRPNSIAILIWLGFYLAFAFCFIGSSDLTAMILIFFLIPILG